MKEQKIIALLTPDVDARLGKIRDKELIKAFHVVDFDRSELIYGKWHPTGSSIEARFYMSRSSTASVIHCIIWLHGSVYASGVGSAGGWGYDKTSAALADAISNAKITLSSVEEDGSLKPWNFGGSGEGSMHTALLSIADAMGIGKPVIIESFA